MPAIRRIRCEGRVWHRLVGGGLLILRLVHLEGEGTWTEMLAFALPRTENHNTSIQPVGYRLCRIEARALRCVRSFDSYSPFPPRP